MDQIGSSLAFTAIAILVFFAIFLLLREINCWYWKINRRIELQEQTNQLLIRILENESASKPANEVPSGHTISSSSIVNENKISLNEMYRRKRENNDPKMEQ